MQWLIGEIFFEALPNTYKQRDINGEADKLSRILGEELEGFVSYENFHSFPIDSHHVNVAILEIRPLQITNALIKA